MFQLLLAIIYLVFISLGLPDAMSGSAWPTIYSEFSIPVSSLGILTIIIVLGTIISSLQSDRLTLKFGTGKITAISVTLTAIALFGFSISSSFIQLCLWAIPYGLGAGSVDASINNYVAINYSSKHMNWLHCMWGVGASLGPYVMGFALTNGYGWNTGYRYVAIIQIVLSIILLISIPLWKNTNISLTEDSKSKRNHLTIKQILKLNGAKKIMVTFFCYCALEFTTGLWASSYLTLSIGISASIAASFASMFYIGITAGRFICGLMSIKFSDTNMIRIGQFFILLGIILLLLYISDTFVLISLILIGLGCAPIYPSIIHSTPQRFGTENSQAIIGVQMASAYFGSLVIPSLFGLISEILTISIFPFYLLLILIIMIYFHESLNK